MRVTIRDLRDARYCLAGVRPWFRRHGFEWEDFLAHGIEADCLRATGDALVEPVIAAAERRRAAALAADTAAPSAPLDLVIAAAAPSTSGPAPAPPRTAIRTANRPEADHGP
jgi:hypothetical protein